jgi:protein-S-isoprenylcysteine O-methyltransferase Ste14
MKLGLEGFPRASFSISLAASWAMAGDRVAKRRSDRFAISVIQGTLRNLGKRPFLFSFSRRLWARWRNTSWSIVILALKNLLFTLVVPGAVGVYVALILSRSRTATTGLVFTLALLLFTTGGSIYAWCVFDFASFGRGTPLPLDAPKKLVGRGLYQYSRNPMYVGVLTVIFGWAVLYQSVAVAMYGLAVALCFYSFVVFFEEPILKKRFGSEYEQYCTEVPRWLPL